MSKLLKEFGCYNLIKHFLLFVLYVCALYGYGKITFSTMISVITTVYGVCFIFRFKKFDKDKNYTLYAILFAAVYVIEPFIMFVLNNGTDIFRETTESYNPLAIIKNFEILSSIVLLSYGWYLAGKIWDNRKYMIFSVINILLSFSLYFLNYSINIHLANRTVNIEILGVLYILNEIAGYWFLGLCMKKKLEDTYEKDH